MEQHRRLYSVPHIKINLKPTITHSLIHTDSDSTSSVKYATTNLDTTANERERLNTVAYDDNKEQTKVNGKSWFCAHAINKFAIN